MPCSEKGCPFPPVPGTDRCRAHPDSLALDHPGTGGAFTLGSGKWWRRIARAHSPAPTSVNGARGSTTTRPPATEPARRKLITLYSQGVARPVVSPLAGRPAPLGVPPTAPTTGRAAKRKMAEKLRALDQPSEGQLAKARRLGIDPAGMGRRQLQQRIEAARRDSGGRNQDASHRCEGRG